MIKTLLLSALLFAFSPLLPAEVLQRGPVQLICHRTANRDAPENTLESLDLAARMGCNFVEVDVRMTLDGQLVLNHDGYLERLTDGMGDVGQTSFDELQMLDAGGWMSQRFQPLRIPLFADAVRRSRELGIALDLDIKQKGEGAAIFAVLSREGMVEHVFYGGDDGNAEDLRALMPRNFAGQPVWLGPDCTKAQVKAAHSKGKYVVANFSANEHEMDLPAMRAAVAAGVDALNVDYPRLGADAVGRSVEAKLAALSSQASHGGLADRAAAIREISHYTGFPTQPLLSRLLLDPDQQISRAAAVALVMARPRTPAKLFLDALSSSNLSARENAAWALGITHAPVAGALASHLNNSLTLSPDERKEVLLAISRCSGDIPSNSLTSFLQDDVPTVRAAAALALASHQPELAMELIPALLRKEEERSASAYVIYVQRGKPKLTQTEIDPIVEDYREHMKLIHALEELPDAPALTLLVREAFRSSEDSSHVTSVLAGYALWDRIADDPSLAIDALHASDVEVADRAEWMLVKAGSSVLPAVQNAIAGATPAVRKRLICILAWQGDQTSLPMLETMRHFDAEDAELIDWAMANIRTLRFP